MPLSSARRCFTAAGSLMRGTVATAHHTQQWMGQGGGGWDGGGGVSNREHESLVDEIWRGER